MFDNRIENNEKVYANNSFDRFGDDLTVEVLQYLTLEDKIRLECVSKQWKRCVFERQFDLETNYPRVNRLRLWNSLLKAIKSKRQTEVQITESLLKKCPNIKNVILWSGINSSVLSLIGRYCPNIKSLSYYSNIDSDNNVLSFFRIYGHKLEELNISGDIDKIKNIITFCPNLKKVFIQDFLFLLTEDKEFLPKLEEILSIIEIFPENRINRLKQMKILSDKYSQTIKTLRVELFDLTYEELKTCIEYISQFENLKELRLDINKLNYNKPIDDCLSLIGQKCNKLSKFELRICNSLLISDQFFDLFYEFKAIIKLLIIIPNNRVLSGSVECFKHCKQLNELHITYPELREDFFANIASFVPKLHLLSIQTDKQFSDSFIELFLLNKYIQKVFLTISFSEEIDNNCYYKCWYFNKCLSDVMTSPEKTNVIRINDNCGLITENFGLLNFITD